MTTRTKTFRITEGPYTAEVEIEADESDGPWAPHVTGDELRKLDTVKLALRRGAFFSEIRRTIRLVKAVFSRAGSILTDHIQISRQPVD